jgi:hypothetical protein
VHAGRLFWVTRTGAVFADLPGRTGQNGIRSIVNSGAGAFFLRFWDVLLDALADSEGRAKGSPDDRLNCDPGPPSGSPAQKGDFYYVASGAMLDRGLSGHRLQSAQCLPPKSPSSIIGRSGRSNPTPAIEPRRREPLNLPHFGSWLRLSQTGGQRRPETCRSRVVNLLGDTTATRSG